MFYTQKFFIYSILENIFYTHALEDRSLNAIFFTDILTHIDLFGIFIYIKTKSKKCFITYLVCSKKLTLSYESYMLYELCK